jgi:hypothetical protein
MDQAPHDARETLAELETRLRQLERELAGLAAPAQPKDPPRPGGADHGLPDDVRAGLGALRAALDDVAQAAERLRAAVRELPPPG